MLFRSRGPWLAAAVLLGAAAVPTSGSATEPPASDERAARRSELDAVRETLRKSDENRRAIAREIESIAGERARLAQALIDAAERARALETALAARESRLADLTDSESRLRDSLRGRRAVLAEVLASLQRMGRQPPPALLVRPDAALEGVRSAILLGAVLPELRVEAEALASDLRQLVRLRGSIETERNQARSDLAALETEQARLAALVEERKRQQSAREQDYVAEDRKVVDLAKQAETLESLIGRMEREIDAARKAAAASVRSDQQGRRDLAALRDPGRLAPAVPFAQAKGLLRLPVAGVRMRTFGSPDGFGGTERGISMATRNGAQVVAPCDGWVVYSGSFRSYGQLLILNAGGGYHVLLAGMERISVELGQFVLTGEPVAAMGGASATAAAVNVGSPQPVLYVEFRKDGVSIDPAPWWSDAASEKVGG